MHIKSTMKMPSSIYPWVTKVGWGGDPESISAVGGGRVRQTEASGEEGFGTSTNRCIPNRRLLRKVRKGSNGRTEILGRFNG